MKSNSACESQTRTSSYSCWLSVCTDHKRLIIDEDREVDNTTGTSCHRFFSDHHELGQIPA